MEKFAKNAKAARKGPPSLATLSTQLGLSAAAISRVLNHAPAARSIPKATQDRIFAAAKKVNYRPNAVARSLRHGRSMTIGVLVPEISEGYTTLVLSGLEQGLLQAGYVYILFSHHYRPDLLERAEETLRERSVDGIVTVGTALPGPTSLPTVTVSCPMESGRVTNITLNHRRAAELAIDHLTGLGHRSVAIIKGQAFSSDTEPRFSAIRLAARRAHIRLNPELITQLEGESPSHEPGYFATQSLLAAKTPFTAIFTFNDVAAIGAIRAIREAGLRVPQDISIVGFDDVQSAAFQNPGLTTVRQPLRTMGMLAAEAIVRAIGLPAEPRAVRKLIVDPEFIVRESTCPPQEKISKDRARV